MFTKGKAMHGLKRVWANLTLPLREIEIATFAIGGTHELRGLMQNVIKMG